MSGGGAMPVEGYALRPHLEAYWLRPECAVWDAIAAAHIGNALAGHQDILELGIGNGFFTFLMLGGRFRPEFDWFRSVDTNGFWNNADIYDHDAGVGVEHSVARAPDSRIRVGLDHKPNLLAQAARLGFVDQLVAHDCNEPLPAVQFSTAYSNMLYWLAKPMDVITNVGRALPVGGTLVTVFPNSGFFDACQSYRDSAPLWTLLNRGRAGHILWHMDPDAFQREIDRVGVFEVRLLKRYLTPLTLKIWDVGLRPLSVPLIKMANALTEKNRVEIKAEWCDTVEKLATPIVEQDFEGGERTGGFCLAVLVRKA